MAAAYEWEQSLRPRAARYADLPRRRSPASHASHRHRASACNGSDRRGTRLDNPPASPEAGGKAYRRHARAPGDGVQGRGSKRSAAARAGGPDPAGFSAPELRRHHVPAHFGGARLHEVRARQTGVPQRVGHAGTLAPRHRCVRGYHRIARRGARWRQSLHGANGGQLLANSILPRKRDALDRFECRQRGRGRERGHHPSARRRVRGVLHLLHRRLGNFPPAGWKSDSTTRASDSSAHTEMESRRGLALVRSLRWPARARGLPHERPNGHPGRRRAGRLDVIQGRTGPHQANALSNDGVGERHRRGVRAVSGTLLAAAHSGAGRRRKRELHARAVQARAEIPV